MQKKLVIFFIALSLLAALLTAGLLEKVSAYNITTTGLAAGASLSNDPGGTCVELC